MPPLRVVLYFICAYTLIKCKARPWSESSQREPIQYNYTDAQRSTNDTINKYFMLNNLDDYIHESILDETGQEMFVRNKKFKRNATNDSEPHSNDTTSNMPDKNRNEESNKNLLKKNIALQSDMDTKESLNIDKSTQQNIGFRDKNNLLEESSSYIVAITVGAVFLILVIMAGLLYTGTVSLPTTRRRNKRDNTADAKKLRYKEVASEEEETTSVVNSNSWKTTFFSMAPTSSCKNSVQRDTDCSLPEEATVDVSGTPSIQAMSTKSNTMKSNATGKGSCEEGLNQTGDKEEEEEESSTVPMTQDDRDGTADVTDSEEQDEFNQMMSLCQKCKGIVNADTIVKRINEIESKGKRVHIPISIPVNIKRDQSGKSTISSRSSTRSRSGQSTASSTRKRDFSTLQACYSAISGQCDSESGTQRTSSSSTSTSKSKPNEDAISAISCASTNKSVQNHALPKPPRKSNRTADSTISKAGDQFADQGEYDYCVSSGPSERKSSESAQSYQLQYESSASQTNQRPNCEECGCTSSSKSVKSSQSDNECDQCSAQESENNNENVYDTNGRTSRSDVFRSECSTSNRSTNHCECCAPTTQTGQSTNKSTDFCEGQKNQSDDCCDRESTSSKASTTQIDGATTYDDKTYCYASSNASNGTCQNDECAGCDASTMGTNQSDDKYKSKPSTEKRNDDFCTYNFQSSETSVAKSDQSVFGSTTHNSVSSKESKSSKDQAAYFDAPFKAPVKIKVLSTDPNFQANTLIVKEHLNKLLTESSASESPTKLTKENLKTGQVIYADVCFVKNCVKSSNGAAKTNNCISSKPTTNRESGSKCSASENGNDAEYSGSQPGDSEKSFFSTFKENACYSGNDNHNPGQQSKYRTCTASVCSDDLPRNKFRKFGNGCKNSGPANAKLKHCTSVDSRAGLIQNLNQRLKGTYLASNQGSSRSRQSVSSFCGPLSEYPTDEECNSTYADIPQSPNEDNEGGNRTPARTGMQKFLPRIKQYMSKRKKSNSLGSEDAYYNDQSNGSNGGIKICPECLKHFPENVGETLKSRRSTFANSKKFQGRSVVHLDELYKLCPNLISDLPNSVKSALSRSTDNLTNAKGSHLCENYERGREMRYSELSSSFENITCLN